MDFHYQNENRDVSNCIDYHNNIIYHSLFRPIDYYLYPIGERVYYPDNLYPVHLKVGKYPTGHLL